MGFETWVDPHPTGSSVKPSARSSVALELGIPRSLAEPAIGQGECTKCGQIKLLDGDGVIMWHPSTETHRQRYNDEGDKRRGCLGVGLPPALAKR